MTELSGPAGQTAVWLDLLRAGVRDAVPRLIEHTCERPRLLTRRMLRLHPPELSKVKMVVIRGLHLKQLR